MPASNIEHVRFIYSRVPGVCDSASPSTSRAAERLQPHLPPRGMHGENSFDFKVTFNNPIGKISFEIEQTAGTVWSGGKEVRCWMIHILYFIISVSHTLLYTLTEILRPGTAVLTEPLTQSLSSNQ